MFKIEILKKKFCSMVLQDLIEKQQQQNILRAVIYMIICHGVK